MFFDKGKVPKDFNSYFANKFVIGSIKHPIVTRLEFFLRRHQQKYIPSSYVKCSVNCDYFNPVGGTFYGIN